MGQLCIGRMVKQGVGFKPSIWETCGNPPGPRNPQWCDECDKERIANIDKSFRDVAFRE